MAGSSERETLLAYMPPAIPAGTSVLVTAGIAIALDVPAAVFARKDARLPYLIQGAVESKAVKARLHEYIEVSDIEKIITNDGLQLFGENAS